ncbi:MAG: hypothetical protein QNJ98_05285 [Planctomycetota bacterium]|nr:hypothetical protein [Planctomycetota bacterium]
MRALILGLSVVIIALVVAIILEVTSRAKPARQAGEEFEAGRLIADALPGETASYREDGGRFRVRTFQVREVPSPDQTGGIPVITIRQTTKDPRAPAGTEERVTYQHRITDHFWFPLTEPRAPEAKDRVWILHRIRRETILHQGKERACWRIDLIDPALAPEAEHVVAWVDPEIPVFGLLQWRRNDETWVLDRATGSS